MAIAAQLKRTGASLTGTARLRHGPLVERSSSATTRDDNSTGRWPDRPGAAAGAFKNADPRTQAAVVAALQRANGNAFVQRLIAESSQIGDGGSRTLIQRCGATSCHASTEEEVGHAVDQFVQRKILSVQREEDEDPAEDGGSAFDSVVDTVSGAVDDVSTEVGQVTESVSDASTAAGGEIEAGFDQAAEGATDLAGAAVESASEGIGAASEAVEGVGGALAGGVSGLLGGLGGEADGEAESGLAVANDAAKTTSDNETLGSCEAFEDIARAEEVRAKLGFVLPAAAAGLFGGAVARLWIDYLGGGTGLQVLTDPSIVEAFATSSTSVDAAEQAANTVKQQVEADKAIPDGVHSLDDEKILRRGRRNEIANTMSFNNPFSIPGHIAGALAATRGRRLSAPGRVRSTMTGA